jgi:PAS domain S-box-containing protein
MLRLFKTSGSSADALGNAPLVPYSGDEASLLDSLGDGVITTDEHDRVTYANRAAAALFGRDSAGLIGEELLNLFAQDSGDAVRFGQSAARDGLLQCYEAEVAGRDECSVSVGAAPLKAENGSIGTVLTLRDVTDMRRAHLEVAR